MNPMCTVPGGVLTNETCTHGMLGSSGAARKAAPESIPGPGPGIHKDCSSSYRGALVKHGGKYG
eukprot:6950353-Karenia_brevis.AAC.1